MSEPTEETTPPGGLSAQEFWLRIVWVAIQLIVVYWFAMQGQLFVYQGF